MKVDPRLHEVVDRLGGEGFREVEVYHKRGRSRSLRLVARHVVTSFREEEGWAVRAGDDRRSFFHAATGAPDPDAPWPEADGEGLRLPSAKLVPEWTAPADLDAPLVGEGEALGLFEGIHRELSSELPGARLLVAQLDDGSSEAELYSSREVSSSMRQRVAILYLEAAAAGSGVGLIRLRLAAREARHFQPLSLARRLADRLLIAQKGSSPRRDRGEFLLAPPVTVALLDALRPLWIGAGAVARITEITDRRGRVASPAFTLVDDGRLPGGVLEAPVDGEGQPTREVVLIEEGIFRQPLVTWRQGGTQTGRPSGCATRASWRDQPLVGPTHLYLRRDPEVGVASLVKELKRGYYLLDTEGAPRLEDGAKRFALPVCGFSIDSGQPTGSVTGAWLVGTVTGFLNGVLSVARDLTFLPSAPGLIGAPTLLVRGLELRRRTES